MKRNGFYDRLVDELLELVSPIHYPVSLDLPATLQDLGGWANRILLVGLQIIDIYVSKTWR